MMSNTKYCRICWNANGWQKPSGDAPKQETQSYVQINGFGHEEWLLNFGWTLDKYKYGFIQGFNTKNQKYQRKVFDVILYTINKRERYFVGKINGCEILTQEMANEAKDVFKTQKWLDEMVEDVKKVNGDYKLLTSERNPLSLLNVRFDFDNVEIFELTKIPETHRLQSYNRYRPLDAMEDFKGEALFSHQDIRVTHLKSSQIKDIRQRIRAAQPELVYIPAHNRLQNSLFSLLIEVHGKDNVIYEANYMDLVVQEEGKLTIYEIKTEPTAKKCIRLAIGQLLEYAHWSNKIDMMELVIVGKVLPSNQDKKYLELLRKRYNIPVHYQRFDTANNRLSEKY